MYALLKKKKKNKKEEKKIRLRGEKSARECDLNSLYFFFGGVGWGVWLRESFRFRVWGLKYILYICSIY